MSQNSPLQRLQGILMFAYQCVRNSVFFQSPLGRRVFFAAYSFYKNHFEDPFAMFVRLHPELFQRGTVLDIGANIGYTAVLFARAGSRAKKVYAFEPESSNVQMLREVLRQRQLSDQVIVIPSAVGARTGTVELWVNPNSHADHRVHNDAFTPPVEKAVMQSVPLISIDDFMQMHTQAQPVSFIKIDVQGVEEDVCRGMTHTLTANPDAVIAIEYYPEGMAAMGFEAANLLNFFSERGYVAHCLSRRHFGRIDPLDLKERLPSPGYVDLIYSKHPLTEDVIHLSRRFAKFLLS